MKFTTLLKGSIVTAAAAVFALMPVANVAAIAPGSVPYQGEETSGTTFPAFNIFNGVPSVGNEADFIRAKKDGEANSALRNQVDTTCATGDRFDIWFYLHNGAKPSTNDNGNGSGVAHNVVAKTILPDANALMSNFTIKGNVTASNAEAINDSAVINCGGKKFKMKYVANSADAYLDRTNTTVKLPDAFVNGGTPIGTNLLDGNVWGCWEQRVWMGLKVEVTEVTDEVQPSYGECKVLGLEIAGTRRVTANLTGEATNGATITGYRINFGDGTVVEKQTESHQYAKDGNYTVTGEVKVRYANGTEEWKSATNCAKNVTFQGDKPPVVTPPTPGTPGVTTLPKTGPAGVAALVSLVTAASTGAYYWVLRRRASQL